MFAHVTPSLDSQGNITGYHSNRRVANREVLDQHIIPLYKALLQIEKSIASPREALLASSSRIEEILKENNMSFNEWMFSLNASH